MDILVNLNDKQKEAVLETEGYVRVIAGAGSGKTKLLVSRYAYLVQDYGIDSANILCVTFTNKAAGEMKRRIRSLIGAEHDTTLICTYHGFCNRLLRENPEKLFMTKQFQIIDGSQQKAILSEIYQKYELQLDYASYESILHKIAGVKSKSDYVTRMCSPDKCRIMPEIKNRDDQIMEEFMQRQKATYSLDFHDLLAFALYLLKTDTDVRHKWQERLNYIQVDEFQDSAGPEMELVEILSAKYQNLMIVGDPDQNIYEWRGSDVSLLVDFDKNHSDTKTIILNQNYRSTPQILNCANTLIEKNQIRLKKDLFTQNSDGAPVYHYHSKNDFEEMDAVVNHIRDLKKEENLQYSDFAILYRSGFLSRMAEKKLVERSIPYEIFGGVKFYQRMEILDVVAYLKLIAFDDDISFRRIVNTPRRRFGQAKMNLLTSMQENNERDYGKQMSLFENLLMGLNLEMFPKSDVSSFADFVKHMRANIQHMRISEIVNKVTADSGYEKYIRELGDEERLDNLAEFKRIANEFEREFGETLTLAEFLQQIALQSGEDGSDEHDTVKLMTIHSSKGLEFPVVFILGFSEGIFPSAKTVEGRKNLGLEEERRLCYVAITRAQKHLFLMDSEGPSQNGSRKLVSRFLDEIGEENYIRIGKISRELKEESRAYASKIGYISQLPSSKEKKVGDEVTHHIFGKGKILEIDAKRGSYHVQFESLAMPRNISRAYFEKRHEIVKESAAPENDSEGGVGKMPDSTEQPIPAMPSAEEEEPGRKRKLEELKANSSNLWKRDDVPHSEWTCNGVTDLGAPVGICEMCGYQIIRYAHHMEHKDYRPIVAGCVCAGKMEGDIEAARTREADLKNQQARRVNFHKRKWKKSKKGNEYLKVDGHIAVIYQFADSGRWKYSLDNTFSTHSYATRDEVIDAIFDVIRADKGKQGS